MKRSWSHLPVQYGLNKKRLPLSWIKYRAMKTYRGVGVSFNAFLTLAQGGGDCSALTPPQWMGFLVSSTVASGATRQPRLTSENYAECV